MVGAINHAGSLHHGNAPKPEILLSSSGRSRREICGDPLSGHGERGEFKRHTDELRAYLRINNVEPLTAPTFAFYNPPWTLPFLRRNEVMIEIRR